MYPCELQEHAPRHTVSIRFRSPEQELPVRFGRVWSSIGEYLGALGEPPVGPPFAIYYNMDMQDLDIEAGVPLARPLPGKGDIQAGHIPGGVFAICHYTGPYDQVGPAYEQLVQFVRERGYAVAGAAYEWYFDGPDVPPQDSRTDIVFPVTRVE